jgi:hypothetical protein
MSSLLSPATVRQPYEQSFEYSMISVLYLHMDAKRTSHVCARTDVFGEVDIVEYAECISAID